MKIDGNGLRPGQIIVFENRSWLVVKIQHTQPGKGGAYMQTELKDIQEGTKKNHRFRSSESIELVFQEEVPHTYLYREGNQMIFMNPETYDQVQVAENLLNGSPDFLQEGMAVIISLCDGVPTVVTLPNQVVCKVEECDPVVKGQTAASSYKQARLDNGIRCLVPPHITVGTKIVVNTEEGTYVERYKEGE